MLTLERHARLAVLPLCTLIGCGSAEQRHQDPPASPAPSARAEQPGHAEEVPGIADLLALPREADGLALSLQLDQRAFRLAEPVHAAVRLRNTSREPRAVVSRLDPSYGALRIVVHTDGITRDFEPLTLAEGSGRPDMIPPGEGVEAQVPIYFGGTGWTFPTAGAYEVHAVWNERLHAAATVLIEAPLAGVESEQARLMLNEPEVGRFLVFGGGRSLTRAAQVLEQVASLHPGTTLAGHAALGLGRNLTRAAVRRREPAATGRGLHYLAQAASAFSPRAQPHAFARANEALLVASENFGRPDLTAMVARNLRGCTRADACLAAIQQHSGLSSFARE